MWKTLRINMTTLSATEEAFKEEYNGLGGRGLIAKVLLDEIDPMCDPLGPGNVLLLGTTALAGCGVAGSNRISVGCKSPLTGGIKEANAGGSVATFMANQGIRLVILEGQPQTDGIWIVYVDENGNARLVEADEYRGMNNYQLVDTLIKRYGDQIAVASIGGAGERLYKNSTVQITEHGTNYPCRACARGGVGSVMGSKKVKAVVFAKAAKRYTPELYDKDKFAQQRRTINRMLDEKSEHHDLRTTGTPDAVRIHYEGGILPVSNFSGKDLKDIDKIYPDKWLNIVRKRGKTGHPCQPGCQIRCSTLLNDEDGNYVTAGLEYETIALCGSNCEILSHDDIARIDRLCDDFGIDTIETGATIGVCMDAGKIPWGDAEAAIGLIKEMMAGTEFGLLMGQGTEAVGKYLGARRIPVAKHQGFPGYDVRGSALTGIAIAAGAQGADHTVGPAVGTCEGIPPEEVCKLSYNNQKIFAMGDNLTCIFTLIFMADRLDLIAELYAAAYGGSADQDRLVALGEHTLKLEKAFNVAAGWKPEDDIIPDFFYQEKSEMTGTTFTIPQHLMGSLIEAGDA